jgi:hypothetical protein
LLFERPFLAVGFGTCVAQLGATLVHPVLCDRLNQSHNFAGDLSGYSKCSLPTIGEIDTRTGVMQNEHYRVIVVHVLAA